MSLHMRITFIPSLVSLIFSLLLSLSTPALAVPPIEEKQLDNGLRILLMEAHNVPMVAMQLTMVGGSRFDGPGKGGSASLLASMLADHTARHDYKSWAALLDAEAIRFGSSANQDGLSLSMTVLKEALPSGLQALTEALLMPGWDPARFKLMKENALAAAEKAQEEPGIRAAEATAQLLFPKHPYGHRPEGNLTTLKQIELNDLKQLYRAQLKPDGAVLAVSGDITMDELLEQLEPLIRTWQGRPEQPLFDKALKRASKIQGQMKAVEMPTSQMLSRLVRLGPDRRDSEFFPVFVLNHLLGGGGFGSRLMEEVREDRGLVYGVYSYFVPLAAPGPFIITLQTRADQAEEAESVVRDVMQELYNGKITKRQLHETQANLIGSFAQRMDSNRERVGLMGMIGYYKLPLNYLQVWTIKIESVTLADLKQAAIHYLDPETWNLVRVGPLLTPESPATEAQ